MNYHTNMEECLNYLHLAAYVAENEAVKAKIEDLWLEVETAYKKERKALYSLLCRCGEKLQVEKYRGVVVEEDYLYNNGLYVVDFRDGELEAIKKVK